MDNRGKKIIIISHCLCNTNSKVCGFSPKEAGEINLIYKLMEKGFGIIQLPCPEKRVYGINRWGQSTEQYDNPHFRDECKKMLIPFVDDIRDYIDNDYNVSLVISVLGSPSCGFTKSFSNSNYGGELNFESIEEILKKSNLKSKAGIFMNEFKKLMDENQIQLKFIDFDENLPDKSIQIILDSLSKN